MPNKKIIFKSLKRNMAQLTLRQKKILYDYLVLVSKANFTIENENVTNVLDDVAALFFDEQFEEEKTW